MSYINETDFVIENKQLVYPEIITDGLQLYYDAKGKRDTDYHRDTMLDMSGNKNHGKLHNFAYEKHSGYKDGLVFDYIDDKLVRPKLNLKPDDFTFMLNGNIISFSPDGTVKRVQDGEVIESKGFNVIENGDFSNGLDRWKQSIDNEAVVNGDEVTITTVRRGRYGLYQTYNQEGLKYISAEYYSEDEAASFALGNTPVTTTIPNGVWTRVSAVNSDKGIIRFYADSGEDNHYIIRKPIIINLTETFGAGNEPTKEEMDEIINRFGYIPNAQDLIDRIEYKGNDLGDMENIIDGLYKTEVLSGEEVYTDKADDDAVVHVEIDGKSYQHAGSGKNLFDIRMIDESITSAGSTVGAPIKLKPNTTYTLSTNATPSSTMRDVFFDINRTVPSSGTNGVSAAGVVTITTDSSGDAIVWVRAGISTNDYNVNDFIEGRNWIQVEEGSVATEYEPPAPTPDYPIDIHNLNDFNVFSSIGKRNIILNSSEPMNPYTATTGIESSVTPEGYYTVVALKDNNNWFYPMALYAMRFNGQIEKNFNVGDVFTFSVDIKSPDSTDIPSLYVLGSTNNGYTPLRGKMGTEFSRFYITSTWADLSSMNLALGLSSRSGTFIFRRMKLEKSSTPTPWIPAQEEITESSNHPFIDKINLLLDEPLRSVKDVKDRLFRDSDGLWKVERNIGETTVDHTVNISQGASSGGWNVNGDTAPFYGYGVPNSRNQPSLTNKFKTSVGSAIVGSDSEGFSSGHASFYTIRINKDRLDTVNPAGFKKWLETNPVEVLYVLSTPTIEILGQELQDKLNNLRSFQDSNYVYTLDGNTNLLDTVPLLNNHWYPSSGAQQTPVSNIGQTATQEPLPVYPGVKIHLTKETAGDNYWRVVWVDKRNDVVLREVSTVNDLVLTAPNGAYGMRVSYPNGSNAVIEFDKSDISQTISENLKPTLHAKFLYNNWYKEDRVINNLMIYNRALTNEEMLQNYKTIKRRWGM